MLIWYLIAATLLLLAGALAGSGMLTAISGVGLLAGLAALGGAPRGPVLLFAFWTTAVLIYLGAFAPAVEPDMELILGLPPGAFWTLFGVWLAPVAVWPLAFALGFRDWMGK